MIKVGDKVKVLTNGFSPLEKDNVYTVTVSEKASDGTYEIMLADDTLWIYPDEVLFELVEESNTQQKIQILFSNFSEFLKEKNKRYGDSVINPVKVFSKVEPENKACIRLDEKLQRIINSTELRKNDVSDTFGYLALLMIDKGWITFEEMLD
jgi:hypothetical protein